MVMQRQHDDAERRHADDGEVQIHLKNIYHELTEVHGEVKKTNGRVRALEKWMWAVGGAITILGLERVVETFVSSGGTTTP